MGYMNPPTVVVIRQPVTAGGRKGLLLVRRALPDGKGKLALPGGYQEEGESWREAGARELLEETGVAADPWSLAVADFDTVPDGSVNLLFCDAPVIPDFVLPQDRVSAWEAEGSSGSLHERLGLTEAQLVAWCASAHEVEECLVTTEPVATAFPMHDVMVEAFFDAEAPAFPLSSRRKARG